MYMIKRLTVILIQVIALTGCRSSLTDVPNHLLDNANQPAAVSESTKDDHGPEGSTDQPLSILFIGNSFTFYNDMPGIFAALAEAGGHQVKVETAAVGGYTLADHVKDKRTMETLQSHAWDYVVLQEQSSTPLDPQARQQVMLPAIRKLNESFIEMGGQVVLFET
jgi:hypothetical protein